MLIVALLLVVSCAVSVALAVQVRREQGRVSALQQQHDELLRVIEQRVARPDLFGHEVRTPLALISGAAELLAEESPGPLTAQQREFVTTITTNARQVVGMAEDLLLEARMQSQLFEPHLARIDLRGLMRDTVREVRRIHPHPIVLVNQGPPLVVDADAGLMRQALWNLVNNAMRHAGEGVTVTVQISSSAGEAIVQVSDDGEGLTSDEREHLFEGYVVGSTRGPGTGLGMMITHRVVTLHGGRVLVDSSPGIGTTIFLTLPLPPREP